MWISDAAEAVAMTLAAFFLTNLVFDSRLASLGFSSWATSSRSGCASILFGFWHSEHTSQTEIERMKLLMMCCLLYRRIVEV